MAAMGEVEEEVENLFLLGRFAEAYELCHSTLEWLAGRGPSPLHSSPHVGPHHFPSTSKGAHLKTSSVAGGSPARPSSSSLDGSGFAALLDQSDDNVEHAISQSRYTNGPLGGDAHHPPSSGHTQEESASQKKSTRANRPGNRRFHDAEEEAAAMRLVILFIQILFELKRQREVTPFVRWFYATEPPGERQQPHHHDVHAIPYQVFFLMYRSLFLCAVVCGVVLTWWPGSIWRCRYRTTRWPRTSCGSTLPRPSPPRRSPALHFIIHLSIF
jgi:hypothetical protein